MESFASGSGLKGNKNTIPLISLYTPYHVTGYMQLTSTKTVSCILNHSKYQFRITISPSQFINNDGICIKETK